MYILLYGKTYLIQAITTQMRMNELHYKHVLNWIPLVKSNNMSIESTNIINESNNNTNENE